MSITQATLDQAIRLRVYAPTTTDSTGCFSINCRVSRSNYPPQDKLLTSRVIINRKPFNDRITHSRNVVCLRNQNKEQYPTNNHNVIYGTTDEYKKQIIL